MFEVVDNKTNRGHLDFWVEVAESEAGSQHDWHQVFADYRATVDNPGACVWRELIAANPEAKVLLTLHPGGAEAWYQSTWETIYLPQRAWQFRLLARLLPVSRKMARMTPMIWDRFHRGTMKSQEAAIDRYEEHIREVKETVPAERLLLFKVSDGWQPLCDFLGEPLPDEPFPRSNDRAQMKKRLRRLSWMAYALVGLPLALLAVVIWLLATAL